MVALVSPFNPHHVPKGYLASGVYGNIKKSEKKDISLIVSNTLAAAAGVFTSNRVCAAPVQVSREHLAATRATTRAILVSSGNANAATGLQGMQIARTMCGEVARALECNPQDVLIAQTGLIGIPLEEGTVIQGTLLATQQLSESGWSDAAEGIMTTDTHPKSCSTQYTLGRHTISVLGIGKGVAMAAPAMATMIVTIVTDAAVAPACLQELLHTGVEDSFHQLSIDGCQSTNDTVFVLANGASGAPQIESEQSAGYLELKNALRAICRDLAIQMAKDAEGTKHFIHCEVVHAHTPRDAKQIAKQIVSSMLVKCAIAGECPYWGRVIAEAGAAGVDLNPDSISISFGPYTVCRGGMVCNHDKVGVAAYMKSREIHILVDLSLGSGGGEAFGSDLTEEYVRINMEKS